MLQILFIAFCSFLFIYFSHSIIDTIKEQYTEPIVRYQSEIDDKVKNIFDSIKPAPEPAPEPEPEPEPEKKDDFEEVISKYLSEKLD
jgi:hypothetical protein